MIVFDRGLFHPLVMPEKSVVDDDDVFVDAPSKVDDAFNTLTGLLNLGPGFRDSPSADMGAAGSSTRFAVIDILLYVRRCFDDASFLDSLNSGDILNKEAWHAWQRHSSHYKQSGDSTGLKNDEWEEQMMKILNKQIPHEELFEYAGDLRPGEQRDHDTNSSRATSFVNDE